MKTVRLDDFLEQADNTCPEKIGGEYSIVFLKPFQEEAYENWVRAGCRGVIIAPTGTGKTIIAGYAVKTLSQPTLVICPTERVLKMWVERLRGMFGINATAYYGQVKKLGRFTVSIYNTVSTHLELLEKFKLIILDEVHHVASDVFQRILGKLGDNHMVMALTATLKREDGKHGYILSKLPVVYYLDLNKALKTGLVAPVRVIPIPVRMLPEEAQEYKSIEMSIARIRMEMASMDGDGDGKLEEELKKKINQRRQILSKLEAKKEAVYEVARKHPDQRILVFSESIESIENLKKYLLERGVKAETYHSGKSERERDMIFREWGKSFNILLSCRALDEGIDVPEVSIAVMIASGLSVRQLVQRKGRIMRPREGKTAILYVVYAQGTVESMIPFKIQSILKGYVRLY